MERQGYRSVKKHSIWVLPLKMCSKWVEKYTNMVHSVQKMGFLKLDVYVVAASVWNDRFLRSSESLWRRWNNWKLVTITEVFNFKWRFCCCCHHHCSLLTWLNGMQTSKDKRCSNILLAAASPGLHKNIQELFRFLFCGLLCALIFPKGGLSTDSWIVAQISRKNLNLPWHVTLPV